jgi:hypothetical protein
LFFSERSEVAAVSLTFAALWYSFAVGIESARP